MGRALASLKASFLAAGIIAAASGWAAHAEDQLPKVRVDGGVVVGRISGDLESFKGVRRRQEVKARGRPTCA